MGLAPTRLAICASYGCVGITVATTMMNYIMIQDWPQDIGGKPVLVILKTCLLSFQLFEMTVSCCHLMVITLHEK
jgi:hypothetical protein